MQISLSGADIGLHRILEIDASVYDIGKCDKYGIKVGSNINFLGKIRHTGDCIISAEGKLFVIDKLLAERIILS